MTLMRNTLAAAAWAAVLPAMAATTADIVVLMDESGSMAGEQAWIATSVPQLDTGLATAGVTGNRYGLVGFGASAAPAPSRVRSFVVGGGQFGTAAQFQAAAPSLQVSGGTEDGWAAIDHALDSYSFRAGVARNLILVTDEDRDNTNATLSFAGLQQAMQTTNTLLNVVVNATFRCGDGSAAIGIIGSTGYKANGSGGFTTCTGGAWGGTGGATFADYVQLALGTGGGAWNLNILRSGGLSAQSFTTAFIDGKVQEIVIQPQVPEPSTYALMLLGLGAMVAAGRRRRR